MGLFCQDGGQESIQITVESLQRYSRKVREGSLSSTMMDLQPSSLNQTTNLAECAVCHQPIPKGRVHYGGVSCYSCRAFFRRNTQREELPTCKNGTSCRVTYQDRKQCSACRYSKCLTGRRAGGDLIQQSHTLSQ